MTVQIGYYYTHISPFAYLGHERLQSIAEKAGATIQYCPISLPGLFAETGGVPLGQRHVARQNYRFLELQRWREKRDISLKLRPAYFPADPTCCDLVAIGIAEEGGPVGAFSLRAMRACWSLDRDISDMDVIAGIVEDTGLDPARAIGWVESPSIKEIYEKNLEEAIHLQALGSPAYVLNGEVFWGQDRLELLADALASGRDPYGAQ
ncbi:MAG: 2-hydroxychromene-2-carboxylate isomerase [Stappiaceae bacterium]